MSLDTPQFNQAMEEAEFLRNRLYKLQDKLELQPHGGDAHVDYLHTMYALIDKEHSIYTRLSLIDSTEARRMIHQLDACKVVGLLRDDEVTMKNVYPVVKGELIELIKQVSGDDWDPSDFELE